MRFNAGQKWYFLSDHRPNEIIVSKESDSDRRAQTNDEWQEQHVDFSRRCSDRKPFCKAQNTLVHVAMSNNGWHKAISVNSSGKHDIATHS